MYCITNRTILYVQHITSIILKVRFKSSENLKSNITPKGGPMTYTVGKIAKKLNVASSTLRYYDKEGTENGEPPKKYRAI